MLCIDLGNTRIKAAYHEDGDLKPLPTVPWPLDDDLVPVLEYLFAGVPQPQKTFVASVVADGRERALERFIVHRFGTPPRYAKVAPIAGVLESRYEDIDALGVDRWMAMLGALTEAGGELGVIDCGTAVTVDLIAGGVHEGGMIAPGLSLMARVLARETARLPDVTGPRPASAGRSTAECINLGCHLAHEGLVRGALTHFDPHGCRRWFVTGGAAGQVVAGLASEFDVTYRPQLVLAGVARYAELCEGVALTP